VVDVDPSSPPGARIADPRVDAPADELLFHALRLGLHDYLAKTGFGRAVIGLSGGMDSSVTAALAVAALGRDNITGVVMPGPYSSEGSRTDAYELAERLGIRTVEMPIEACLKAVKGVVDPAFASIGEGGSAIGHAFTLLPRYLLNTVVLAGLVGVGVTLVVPGNASKERLDRIRGALADRTGSEFDAADARAELEVVLHEFLGPLRFPTHPLLMARFGVNATCRASFAVYNTKDEVDAYKENDPIASLASHLMASESDGGRGCLSEGDWDSMQKEVKKEVMDAIKLAESQDDVPLEELHTDVYALPMPRLSPTGEYRHGTKNPLL